MDGSSFDRMTRALGSAFSRRAALAAAAAAALGRAGQASAKNGEDLVISCQSTLAAKPEPAASARASTTASGDPAARKAGDARRRSRRPRPEGPCGDGSRTSNACSKDAECCTGICNMKVARKNKDGKGRCRCIKRGKACTANRNCCNGLKCANGVCSGKAPVATGDPCSKADTCAARNATCTTYEGGEPAGTYCLLPRGAACDAGNQCALGACADGVCATCSCGSCVGSCGAPTVCPTCAYTTIQAAINDPAAGDTIVVAAGSWIEDLTISRNLTLRACEAGSVTIRNTAYGVRTVTITNGSRLDLIDVIIDGYHDFDTAYGGGIATNGNLNICGATIVRNGGWPSGGGISIAASGVTLTVTDTASVRDNRANDGGGIHVDGESDIVITGRAVIRENTANATGGGITAINGPNLTVSGRAAVTANTAGDGGGIDHRRGTSSRYYATRITDDASVSGNTSTIGDGGGIVAKIYGNNPYHEGALIIDGRASISGNTTAYDGGAISICAVPTTISGSAVISGNTATSNASGNGGAIWISGGVPRWPAGVVGLTVAGKAAISGNSANQGGALYLDDTTVDLADDARLSGNQASGGGGGVYLSTSNCTQHPSYLNLTGNSAITGNSASTGGGVYSQDADNIVTGSAAITGNTPDNCAGSVTC